MLETLRTRSQHQAECFAYLEVTVLRTEKRVRARASLSSRLSTNSSIQDLADGRPHLDCLFFFLSFWAPSFLVHVRHFVLFLDLLMTSHVKTMLKANLVPLLEDTPGTTRGTKLSVLHVISSSFL